MNLLWIGLLQQDAATTKRCPPAANDMGYFPNRNCNGGILPYEYSF
ncbi:hypothetical protein [Cerasicoccus maritimus]|nr:hypothetical protein [Cerasicoccus maritimus]